MFFLFKHKKPTRMIGGMLSTSTLKTYLDTAIVNPTEEDEIKLKEEITEDIDKDIINSESEIRDILRQHIWTREGVDAVIQKEKKRKLVGKMKIPDIKKELYYDEVETYTDMRDKEFILRELDIIDTGIDLHSVGSGDRFEVWFQSRFNVHNVIGLPIKGGSIINTKSLATIAPGNQQWCPVDFYTTSCLPINAIVETKCYSGNMMSTNFKLQLTKFRGNPMSFISLYFEASPGVIKFWNAITTTNGIATKVFPVRNKGYDLISVAVLGDGLFYYDLTADNTINWSAIDDDPITFQNAYRIGCPQVQIDAIIQGSGKKLYWFEEALNTDRLGVNKALPFNFEMWGVGKSSPSPCLKIKQSKLKPWKFKI